MRLNSPGKFRYYRTYITWYTQLKMNINKPYFILNTFLSTKCNNKTYLIYNKNTNHTNYSPNSRVHIAMNTFIQNILLLNKITSGRN